MRRVEETVICDKARLWPCTTAFVRPSSIFVRNSTRVASQSGPLLFVLVNFWISLVVIDYREVLSQLNADKLLMTRKKSILIKIKYFHR